MGSQPNGGDVTVLLYLTCTFGMANGTRLTP